VTRLLAAFIVALGVAAGVAVVSAQKPAGESFTATASVKRGGASLTAPVRITITRMTTGSEREGVVAALKAGGTSALRTKLESMPDVGMLRLADRVTPIKFASERQTADGRLITVATATPIVYLGAGLPAAKTTKGFEVAIAIFEVKPGGSSVGDLSPAAQVALDESGAVVIDDYGSSVVWLTNIAKAQQ
jgi:hypothetical protein